MAEISDKARHSPKAPEDWLDQLTKAWDTETLLFDPQRDFAKLDKAIIEKARTNPEELMDEAVGMALAFDLRLLARVQWIAGRWIREWDRLHAGGPISAPRELADAVEEMARIVDHLVELMSRHARFRHVSGLAEETKAVRGSARKFREALRVVAHPTLPKIGAASEEPPAEPLEEAV